MLFLVSLPICNAQILGWQFGNPASAGNEASYNATTVHPNLEVSTLVRGTGLEPSSFQRGFSSRLPAGSTATLGNRATAVNNDLYLELKVKAKEGYYTSLAVINAKLRRSGKSPSGGYVWMYSLKNDGSGFTPIGDDVAFSANNTTDGDVQAPIDLSGVTELQNVPSATTITLRLYVWGFLNAASNSFAIGHLDAGMTENVLSVNGIVSNAPIILAWQFGGNPHIDPIIPASTGGEVSFDATTNESNLEVSTLVRGAGLRNTTDVGGVIASPNGAGGLFNATLINVIAGGGTRDNAKTNNMYFEFKVKAKAGYYASLSDINVRLWRNGSTMVADNLPGYCWAYSLDNDEPSFIGNYTVFASSSAIVRDEFPVNLSGITALQNVPSTKTITLRLYVWGFANARTNPFAIGPTTSGTQENVISIGGKVSNTLPVRFSEVKTRLNNNDVDVLWTTSFEKNNDYFEVQRSANSSDFYKIGRVEGGRNSDLQQTYSFLDLNPALGPNYYRIKQVDFDGGFIYSPIAVQKFSAEIVRPLTVQVLKEQQLLKVTLNSSYNGLVPLEVAGIDGRVVYKEDFKLEKGVNTLVLSLKAKSGIYILRTKIDRKAIATKFIY